MGNVTAQIVYNFFCSRLVKTWARDCCKYAIEYDKCVNKMEDLHVIGRKWNKTHECRRQRRRRTIYRTTKFAHSLRTVSKIIILCDDDYCNYSTSCSINSLVCQRSESVSGEYFMVRMWACVCVCVLRNETQNNFPVDGAFQSVRVRVHLFLFSIFIILGDVRGERCGWSCKRHIEMCFPILGCNQSSGNIIYITAQ